MGISSVCKNRMMWWGIACLFILSAGNKTVMAQASFTGLGGFQVSFSRMSSGTS